MERITALFRRHARPIRPVGSPAAPERSFWRAAASLIPDLRAIYDRMEDARELERLAGMLPVDPAKTRISGGGKILVVVHDLGLGGAQQVALNFARWLLRETDHDVRFVALRGGAFRGQFETVAELFCIEDHARRGRAATSARLESWADGDVSGILVNSVVSGSFYRYWQRPTPSVAFVHELAQILERHLPALDQVMAHANRIVAGSGAVRELLGCQPGMPLQRLAQAYPFIEQPPWDRHPRREEARKTLGVGPDQVLVFGCGVMHWRKSPDLFLDVAARVSARTGAGSAGEIGFVWLGSGPDRNRSMRRIRRENLHAVRISGYLPDVASALCAADLFLLPSEEDAFPLSALEAALAGLPVICFRDAGGMPELVARGCGLAVPFRDTEAMAEAVLAYAADPERRRREGETAHRIVMDEFVVEKGAPAIYEHLCAVMEVCHEDAGALSDGR